MALVHHHHHSDMSPKEKNRCAAMFVLTWVGFFAVISLVTWVFKWL